MTGPAYEDEKVTVYLGDCRDVLRGMPSGSVDSIVTDPPYELGFMGRGWDSSGITYDVAMWRECLRVLKPGGHLLSFGGTRTWHRMVCAVEDAGFEIRDTITWMYASGFPKSLDVSKAIDQSAGAEREPGTRGRYSARRPRVEVRAVSAYQDGVGSASSALVTAPATDAAREWAGWGTALKPASEPICVARKPLSGTVAATVLEHGTGALNIDGCRVDTSEVLHTSTVPNNMRGGRWPSNAVFSHAPECGQDDSPTCVEGCPVAELDGQSGVLHSQNPHTRTSRSKREGITGFSTGASVEYADSGGASRFFPTFRYEAKAPTAERPTYVSPMLRLRSGLTPEQVDHVTAQLRAAGVEVA